MRLLLPPVAKTDLPVPHPAVLGRSDPEFWRTTWDTAAASGSNAIERSRLRNPSNTLAAAPGLPVDVNRDPGHAEGARRVCPGAPAIGVGDSKGGVCYVPDHLDSSSYDHWLGALRR